jgi:DNA-binding GntR family transcriptional regulator
LWYLALPRLEGLPSAVGKHVDLVEAIRGGDADRSEETMREHVEQFYDQVQTILTEQDQPGR